MKSFKYKKLKPDRSELEEAGINFLQRSLTGKYVPGQKEGKETKDNGKNLDTKNQTMLKLFDSGGPQTHHSNRTKNKIKMNEYDQSKHCVKAMEHNSDVIFPKIDELMECSGTVSFRRRQAVCEIDSLEPDELLAFLKIQVTYSNAGSWHPYAV